ncbi:MAG TPA: hypothetical protein VJV76_09090 [Gaiellaceae bacterium]|nr:hypothetical protein [Gaiellaceae bacterium]
MSAVAGRPFHGVACLLIALATFGMSACAGRSAAKPHERWKESDVAVRNRHLEGGALDAQVRQGERVELRIFVTGPGGPGGVVHLNGYGLAARVKRQPPVSGFWARLRFHATRVGRFAVVMERPHLRIGYVTVRPA